MKALLNLCYPTSWHSAEPLQFGPNLYNMPVKFKNQFSEQKKTPFTSLKQKREKNGDCSRFRPKQAVLERALNILCMICCSSADAL